jgi:hypothetical protein
MTIDITVLILLESDSYESEQKALVRVALKQLNI